MMKSTLIFGLIFILVALVIYTTQVDATLHTKVLIQNDVSECEQKWKECSLQQVNLNGITFYQVQPDLYEN